MTNPNEETIADGDEQATDDAVSRTEFYEPMQGELIEADVVTADELLPVLG